MSQDPKNPRALVKYTQQQLAKASQSLTALAELFGPDGYNLLAPTVHMAIPQGMSLAITEVRVSPLVDDRGAGEDVVKIGGGNLLVRKHKLDQIANGAGISWIQEQRLDGGQHPHYFEAFVRGKITDYDGTVRELVGSKTIDLRESVGGVPGKDYDEIVSKAAASNRDPTNQLREARKFGAEIAFSKAKNRAIAQALGIKRSYTAAELQKPFVIPKLILDPGDPDARELIMANAAGATSALYGAKAAAAPKVVDVPFEEADAETSDEPDHDPVTGEVVDGPVGVAETPADVIIATWARAKAAGITGVEFAAICKANCGKSRKEDMSIDEAVAVANAVAGRIAASSDPEDDGCPV
ncbi:MAG: hypothetical protein ABH877_04230 [bacterium]